MGGVCVGGVEGMGGGETGIGLQNEKRQFLKNKYINSNLKISFCIPNGFILY